MDTPGDKPPTLGETLYAAGWRQGVLFTLPSASFARLAPITDANADATPRKTTMTERPVKPKERLILVTQDCDLVASDNEEPYVEALICAVEKPDRAALLDRNSARYFLVDPATSLVARARYRISLEKRALQNVEFSLWPGSPERHERFVRWLARRYDRPAIPDALYDTLQRPIDAALSAIDSATPQVGAAFSRAVHEIRINMPESETPPFDLQMIFLITLDGVTNEEADALFAVWDAIQKQIDPYMVTLDPDLRILTAEDISLAEYLATRPLFLEYFTYKGEEIEGQPPLPRF